MLRHEVSLLGRGEVEASQLPTHAFTNTPLVCVLECTLAPRSLARPPLPISPRHLSTNVPLPPNSCMFRIVRQTPLTLNPFTKVVCAVLANTSGLVVAGSLSGAGAAVWQGSMSTEEALVRFGVAPSVVAEFHRRGLACVEPREVVDARRVGTEAGNALNAQLARQAGMSRLFVLDAQHVPALALCALQALMAAAPDGTGTLPVANRGVRETFVSCRLRVALSLLFAS